MLFLMVYYITFLAPPAESRTGRLFPVPLPAWYHKAGSRTLRIAGNRYQLHLSVPW